MSDVEEDTQQYHDETEDHAHQACYVFHPFTKDDSDDRPTKKRKVKHKAQERPRNLPLLEHGEESEAHSRERGDCLRRYWTQKKDQVDQLMSRHDSTLLHDIIDFAASANVSTQDGRLRTGLVVSGSDNSIQARVSHQWRKAHKSRQPDVLIQVTASLCPNLQTGLKNIIKSVLVECVGSEGYSDFSSKHKRLIPMNFDLELLQIFAAEHKLQRIIVSLLDVETFDTAVLSQLLWSLTSWSQRIPFVTLLGIATTVDLFESRLPKSTVEHLDTKIFRLSPANDLLYQIFTTFQTAADSQIFLGPATLAALSELSQQQSTTAASFISAIKLMLMSHFFANSLSVMACQGGLSPKVNTHNCKAIRVTDSFRDYCENLINEGKQEAAKVRQLLQDDESLLSTTRTAVTNGQTSLRSALQTIAGLQDIRRHLGLEKTTSFAFDLELYNCLDDMRSSSAVQNILDRLRTISSARLIDLLESIEPTTLRHFALEGPLKKLRVFQDLHRNESIRAMQEDLDASSAPSPSPAKSPTKSNSIQIQKQYTTLLVFTISQLKGTIQANSYAFEPFMHEAFVINQRHLLLSLTRPKPRQVLERALARPGDYLSCECGTEETNLNGNETTIGDRRHLPPPTSVLYHLLQEAGTIINVRDLFDAFQSRLDPDLSVANDIGNAGGDSETENDDDDHEHDIMNADPIGDGTNLENNNKTKRRMALCLFFRSLSELKMMGMVKSSTSAMTKKRALASENGVGIVGKGKKAYAEIDFIAKTSWAGL